jgi:hypothetical protein
MSPDEIGEALLSIFLGVLLFVGAGLMALVAL